MTKDKSILDFLEHFDLYAPPIRMTYKGKESHQTKCGGFLTIIFYTGLITFFCQNLLVLITKGNDQYSQNKIFNDEQTSMKLTKDLLDIQISYIGSGRNANFDLNKYFTFKLHRYTNIQNFNESLPTTKQNQDILIPLTPCNKNHESDNGWDFKAPMYCPEFKSTDILKGSYYTKQYSWLRLAVHRCDPTEKVMIDGRMRNKQCASRQEQDIFFENKVLTVLINKQEPNLKNHEEKHIMKRNKDLLYSAKVNNGMVTFYEYWFEKSRIELNNDLSGFKDNVETLDVIQFNNGI